MKFCIFHDYEIKHEYIKEYYMTISLDSHGDGGKIYYDVYLLQCKKCDKRKFKAVGKYNKDHSGINQAKYRWLKFGRPPNI